jgi:hypothetical protein
MATYHELREQQQREAYVEALRREHAGYIQHGRTDRADQVADVLAELGIEVPKVTPKEKREPSIKRRMLPERAVSVAKENG